MKKRTENIIIIILTIFTEILSIKLIRPKIFSGYIESKFSYWFINVIFVIVLLIIYKFLFFLIKKLKNKDEFYIKLLKYSGIYFLGMTVFLLIIYPGTWLWDEFWIVTYARNYILCAWQSYISVIIYTIVFYIIPHPIGQIIFQTICISIIVGYVQTRISYHYNKKIINVILYLIFFTPVFLINNLYLLRTTLYTYVILIFYCIIIFDYLEKKTMTKKKLIILLFLTFLMVNWRSEGIVFAISNVICLIIAYPNIRNKICIAKIILFIVISTLIYSKMGADKMYTATTTVLPLSIMLNEELQGENIEKDIESIDRVFDVEKLKCYPNYHFMQAYWDGNIEKENAENNIDMDFYKSFIDIVINNFGKFLDVRFKVFLYTFQNIEYSNNCYIAYLENWEMPEIPTRIVGDIVEEFNFRAINLDLKLKTESLLIENTTIKIIFWNIIPFIILLSLLFILINKMLKKDWLVTTIILTLFAKMTITFFTSTASYYMYYFTEYVIGIFISYIILVQLKKNRK